MKPVQWEVPVVFALTLTQIGGSGVAKLFTLSDAAAMQKASKFVEICTAFTVVVSGAVIYFAWGEEFQDPDSHGKELVTAFASVVLLPTLVMSPLAVTVVIGAWQLVRWMVVEFHRGVVVVIWEQARRG